MWAHAFAATTVHSDPAVNGGDPRDTGAAPLLGSRLLAPRRRRPQTTYTACLVPTLAAAALAGLGGAAADIAAALAAPQPNYAWSLPGSSARLPVYFSWEFSCSQGGDFESMARELKEVPVPSDFGTRAVDLGLAGAGIPASRTTVRFRGALTAPSTPPPPTWPDPDPAVHDGQLAVNAALRAEIAAAAALTAAAAVTAPHGRRAVGPLLYAAPAAGRGLVSETEPAADWFDQLNRDPRNRAVAGLGTRVLRRNAEDMMTRAWEQVGDVQRANEILRRLQMSRTVVASLHQRHLSALSPGRLLAVGHPLLGRVRLPAAAAGGAAPDALAAVAASQLPGGATWRGLTVTLRQGTRLGDAAHPPAAPTDAVGRLVSGLLSSGLSSAPAVPDGTFGMAAPSAVLGPAAAALITDQVRAAAVAAGLPVPAAGAADVPVLDDLVRRSAGLGNSAATALAAQTGAQVRARALPVTAVFTSVGATLVSQAVPGTARAIAAPGGADGPVKTEPPVPIPGPVIPAGTFGGTTAPAPVKVTIGGTDARLALMRDAYADSVDRYVRAGAATAAPAATRLDIQATRAALLDAVNPARTFATLAHARVPAAALVDRPDPVAPVMVGPVFGAAAYQPLVTASHDAFVPGLDGVPPDSVTLVQTNPAFIAAYLAGLNTATGHELLFRGYPTDERGTYWHSFWGACPDIGPLHQFTGQLADNVTSGAEPLLVLILRGRLLRRYPDSDIYAVLASNDTDLPELDGDSPITRPVFRDSVEPDITLAGFPLTLDDVVGTATGTGFWIVIAEHPGQPRFGLTDPGEAIVHPPLPAWDELQWTDLGPAAANAAYVPAEPPAMAPAGTTRHWGATAADMAAITYQPAVRVAIRARDLLRSAK